MKTPTKLCECCQLVSCECFGVIDKPKKNPAMGNRTKQQMINGLKLAYSVIASYRVCEQFRKDCLPALQTAISLIETQVITGGQPK